MVPLTLKLPATARSPSHTVCLAMPVLPADNASVNKARLISLGLHPGLAGAWGQAWGQPVAWGPGPGPGRVGLFLLHDYGCALRFVGQISRRA